MSDERITTINGEPVIRETRVTVARILERVAQGKRPEEIVAEWEKAARGTEGFVYPWGNEWRDGVANTSESGIGSVMPVGSFPEGASPYGAEDMAGNVSEWAAGSPASGQETQVIRGGVWNAISRWAQTFAHNEVRPTYTQDNLGFRCAK